MGAGKMKECPCESYSQEKCSICNDNQFSDIQNKLMAVIWEQKEKIKKLSHENEIMASQLKVIRTIVKEEV
jgi:hypothetical protein